MQSFENLDRLLNLERLERLQSFENSKIDIKSSSKSYDEIEIKPNSVIYCDIPYRNTAIYNKEKFDYDKFYDWCLKQTEPVFVSEYWMPETDFICIAEKQKTCSLNANNNPLKSIERIFIPKHQKRINEQMKLF